MDLSELLNRPSIYHSRSNFNWEPWSKNHKHCNNIRELHSLWTVARLTQTIFISALSLRRRFMAHLRLTHLTSHHQQQQQQQRWRDDIPQKSRVIWYILMTIIFFVAGCKATISFYGIMHLRSLGTIDAITMWWSDSGPAECALTLSSAKDRIHWRSKGNDRPADCYRDGVNGPIHWEKSYRGQNTNCENTHT